MKNVLLDPPESCPSSKMAPFSPPDLRILVSFIHEAAWKTVFDPQPSWLEPITRLVFKTIDLEAPVIEVSFLFADDAKVQELNRVFRRQDKPTNVLSFPSFEREDYDHGRLPQVPVLILGDIVFALETIQKEAISCEKTFEAHLTHLLIHGLLHLRGYDHETEDEALEMENMEIDLLSHLGFSNPYTDVRVL